MALSIVVGVRCRVTRGTEEPEMGMFLGLMYERGEEDLGAVVRIDGRGLFVTTVHPSHVELLQEHT